MSADKNILLLAQAEAEADLMISQLMQFKERVTKLKKTMAGVSTPALGNGQELDTDASVIAVLNKIDRTFRNQQRKK